MRTVRYNNNDYYFVDSNDPSANGSIFEIIERDDYGLSEFSNLETAMIDIGANHGVAAIIMAKQNPKSTIYAFEPDSRVFSKFIENIRINNITNIVAECLAVSDSSDKTLELMMHPAYSGGNTTCSHSDSFKSRFGNTEIIHVKCISLDDIIMKHNIKNIGLLKIDCEGAEYDVLFSSQKFREHIVGNIVGEYHNLSYNTKCKNNSDELTEYTNKYVSGIKKITYLTL
jgi:FkbM family methyltransferase